MPNTLPIGQIATLIFDLRNANDLFGTYFHNREADNDKPWVALEYDVCGGGVCLINLPILINGYPPFLDTYEPNNTFDEATTISPSTPYTSFIWLPTDEDWFQFNVNIPPNKARFIDIWLEDIPLNADYDLALYNPTGDELDISNNGGNTNEHIREWVEAGGAYRAKIYPYDNSFNQSDAYSLTVEISIAPFRRP